MKKALSFDAQITAVESQYQVTPEQVVMAAQNAEKTTGGVECQEWLDAFAASLGAFEEENEKGVR